jgi:hypothetical protein
LARGKKNPGSVGGRRELALFDVFDEGKKDEGKTGK